MKSKNLLIYTLIAAPVCMLLRVLQYIYIIDSEGNYVTVSLLDKVLEYSTAAALVLCALVALVFMVLGNKTAVAQNRISSKRTGMLFLIIAALMLFESGISIGRSLVSFELDLIGITGVLAAVCYAVHGLCFVKEGKMNTLSKFLGLFPPAYFCVRGIVMFFDSFKLSNISENRLEMLAICALALWSVTLSCIIAGAKMRERRLSVLSMLLVVFVLTPFAAQLVGFVQNPSAITLSSVSWLLQKLLFAVASVIVLLRTSFMKEEIADADPEPIEFNNDLNVYIDDIPEATDE